MGYEKNDAYRLIKFLDDYPGDALTRQVCDTIAKVADPNFIGIRTVPPLIEVSDSIDKIVTFRDEIMLTPMGVVHLIRLFARLQIRHHMLGCLQNYLYRVCVFGLLCPLIPSKRWVRTIYLEAAQALGNHVPHFA